MVVGAISLFTAQPLANFLHIISYAGPAMVVLSVAAMLLTFRTAREVQRAALFVSAATTVFGTLMSMLLAQALPGASVMLGAVALGGLVGVGWSFTSLLFIDEGRVRARGTA